MRQLVAQVSQVPLSGGMMVYIIDEVHMLSKEAFNAFLKTLEEPPPHAVFVLATTEPGKLLATIHSRCQHFAFRRIPFALVADHVGWICREEKVPAEDAALRLIARAGDGSVRDSISILEQAIAFEPEGITLKGVRDVLGIPDRLDIRILAGHILSGNPGELSAAFAKLIQSGREPNSILSSLLGHFRDLLFAALHLEHSDLDLLPDEERRIVESQASGLALKEIHGAISSLAKCEGDIKWEEDSALLLEVHLLRLASKFGRIATEETREARPAKPLPDEPGLPMETFPAAGETERPPQAPARQVGRTSLTGGASLKRKKTAEDAPQFTPQPSPGTAKSAKAAKSESDNIKIADKAEPFWRNALESLREISPSAFLLLAEAIPSPPPSEWPEAKGESAEPLRLTLMYPPGDAIVARLASQPSVANRLVTRLEEILERRVEMKFAHEKGERGETDDAPRQSGMFDGEGPVPGASEPNGPTLFHGAGRPAPPEPELNRIHNLIVNDFPDYRVEYFGDSG
jgi:DNA polymerase-3 subunit gamma/tau